MNPPIIQTSLTLALLIGSAPWSTTRAEPAEAPRTTTRPASQPTSQPTAPWTLERWGRWLDQYRHAPDPARVPEAILALERLSPENRYAIFFGFGELLRREPSLAIPLAAKAAQVKGQSRALLLMLLHYIDTPESRALLVDLRGPNDGWLDAVREPPRLLEMPVPSGRHLDALWWAHDLTGDPAYVQRIAQQLPRLSRRGVDGVVGGAARWSLTSQAARYDDVWEALRGLMKTATPVEAQSISDVILAVQARKRGRAFDELARLEDLLPKGAEQSRVWVTLRGGASLSWGVDGAAAEVALATTASRGDYWQVHTIYRPSEGDTAPEATAQVQILDPSGAVYGELPPEPCGVGAQGRSVILCESFVTVQIEPHEALGAYTIKSLVRYRGETLSSSAKITITAAPQGASNSSRAAKGT